MTGRPAFTIAIQAGGMSRRMGQDKSIMSFHGKPLIQWVVERSMEIADEVLVISNQPEKMSFLNCPTFQDYLPGSGPLGGLFTALIHAHYSCVGVLACDMPFVNRDLLLYESCLLMDSNVDVVIPESKMGLEPFHAVYRRETCQPIILNALQSGEMRVMGWFDNAHIRCLTDEQILPFDLDHLAFINLNTPEQYFEAESLRMGTSQSENKPTGKTTIRR